MSEASLIWPWWVRLSHWLVALGVIAVWLLTYCYYETDTLHRWLGYSIVVIIAIRILLAWHTQYPAARLGLPNQQAIATHLAHLKQLQLPAESGHNPLGQIAVYLMWALIALLACTGWLSRTDWFWGEDLPVEMHAWLSTLLMVTVCVHVLAVLLMGRLAKQHLILQMLHGKHHLYRKNSD
jgi:cytochrome b